MGISNYVVFDTETTGLNPNMNEIIEIGAWKIKDGVTVDKFLSFIKPKAGFVPDYITKINGITTQMVADAEPSEVVIPEFIQFCEDLPLLGYNLDFDVRFVNSVEDLSQQGTRKGIDVLKMSKQILGNKTENHKLGTVVDYFDIKVNATQSRGFHSAVYDAYMTKLVYDRLCTMSASDWLYYIPQRLVQKGAEADVEKLPYL